MLDTVIIGAGLAGLAAGQYLIENKVKNFVVLESGDQIGGRIGTIEFKGEHFSTGPGWLHGRKGNAIFDIMHSLGIKIQDCPFEEEQLYVCDTKDGKEVTHTFEEKSRILDELFRDVAKKLSDSQIESQQSVFDVLRSNSHDFLFESDIDKTVNYATKEIFIGAPFNDVSALAELQFDHIYGADDDEINFRILDPFGVSKMINHISKEFKDKIKLRHKVERIVWDNVNHVAFVITNDGEEFKCKNVIVTLPCVLLFKNVIKFEPELPKFKSVVWGHVPSVNYCRVFAKFQRRFWPEKDWLIAVNEDVDPFDDLILWQNPYKQNLCSINDSILICHFTSGYKREKSRFDVDKSILISLVTKCMKDMFPSTYLEPEDVEFVSHWHNDRLLGSFSTITPGFDRKMMEDLRRSIGPLHFAGESTSEEFMGTMQGAYVTGREAAKNICLDF